jgi:hypothetical protein
MSNFKVKYIFDEFEKNPDPTHQGKPPSSFQQTSQLYRILQVDFCCFEYESLTEKNTKFEQL